MLKCSKEALFFRLVQAAAVCVFLGRAWQHLFWDAPFRALLWDERWMSPLVTSLTAWTWEEYITSHANVLVELLTVGFGYLYLLCALVALFIKYLPKVLTYLLWVGAAGLIFLAFLYCKEKFFSLGQFFEYALQFSSPLFLWLLLDEKYPKRRMMYWMKIAIALTFTCHGLYALNYYPRPGNFVEMVISILGTSEETAYTFLTIAGILDIVVAVLIFIPGRVALMALAYAALWGLGTSVARLWANFYVAFPLESLHQWGFEMVLRLPHFLVVLGVLVWMRKSRMQK